MPTFNLNNHPLRNTYLNIIEQAFKAYPRVKIDDFNKGNIAYNYTIDSGVKSLFIKATHRKKVMMKLELTYKTFVVSTIEHNIHQKTQEIFREIIRIIEEANVSK